MLVLLVCESGCGSLIVDKAEIYSGMFRWGMAVTGLMELNKAV